MCSAFYPIKAVVGLIGAAAASLSIPAEVSLSSWVLRSSSGKIEYQQDGITLDSLGHLNNKSIPE